MAVSDKLLATISFPITACESVYFATTGAFVEKASLVADGRLLSVIPVAAPPNADNTTRIELPFFGTVPFHGALAEKWKAVITLHYRDNYTPTLLTTPAEKNVTWAVVGAGQYNEIVVSGSDLGLAERMLVYMPDTCGFQRNWQRT